MFKFFNGEDENPYGETDHSRWVFWDWERALATSDGLAYVAHWEFHRTLPKRWPGFLMTISATAIEREIALMIYKGERSSRKGMPPNARVHRSCYGIEDPRLDWSVYFGETLTPRPPMGFRFFKGEQTCPFSDSEEKSFWYLESYFAGWSRDRFREAFLETNPLHWPAFFDRIPATADELAVLYVLWLDHAIHSWGYDGSDGERWVRYMQRPVSYALRNQDERR